MNAEELLKLPETKNRLEGYGDDYSINQKIEKDLAKTKNYKRNKFYHATGGLGEIGLGSGLYLGKDRNALNNFYNSDGQEGEIIEYFGNPNFIDLANYDDFDKFENQAIKKYPYRKYHEHLKLLTIEMDCDGIKYYDPIATGEEFILFNTDKVKLFEKGKLDERK